MKHYARYLITLLLSGMISLPTSAQICERSTIIQNTPTENFVTINPDSTKYVLTFPLATDGSEVLDLSTGLIWKRCSVGQTWDQTNYRCKGIPSRLSWQEALLLADTTETNEGKPWRVPNVKEMVSIVDYQCMTPPFNLEVFPNTPASVPAPLSVGTYGSGYWTSSPKLTPSSSTTIWWIDTHMGETSSRSIDSGINYFVRFVRSE